MSICKQLYTTAPNASTVAIVGQPMPIKWNTQTTYSYTLVQLSPDVLPRTWSNIGNSTSTDLTWTVAPLVDGKYMIRLVGETCTATMGVSPMFRIVNPVSIYPAKDNFGPSSANSPKLCFSLLVGLAAMLALT